VDEREKGGFPVSFFADERRFLAFVRCERKIADERAVVFSVVYGDVIQLKHKKPPVSAVCGRETEVYTFFFRIFTALLCGGKGCIFMHKKRRKRI
jgi:hypothetical protein